MARDIPPLPTRFHGVVSIRHKYKTVFISVTYIAYGTYKLYYHCTLLAVPPALIAAACRPRWQDTRTWAILSGFFYVWWVACGNKTLRHKYVIIPIKWRNILIVRLYCEPRTFQLRYIGTIKQCSWDIKITPCLRRGYWGEYLDWRGMK
jgi:hypothetical protein